MQKIIIFDPLTAADVKKRLEEFQSVKNYLNAVMLTAARMNGASPDSVVDFTPDGAGVVITTPDAPEAEVEPSEGAENVRLDADDDTNKRAEKKRN